MNETLASRPETTAAGRALSLRLTQAPRALTIASGKGGVGKTTFAINLAVALAEMGYRVLLFDGDLGMANAQIGFDCRYTHDIGDVLGGRVALDDVLVDTGHGVTLVPGASGRADLAALTAAECGAAVQLFAALQDRFDYLLVDCADGIAPSVITFLKGSHYRLIVGTEEMASIADAYATIKVMVQDHRLENICYVPNCVSSEREGELLFGNLNNITQRFLGTRLQYLGSVVHDDFVNTSWRRAIPALKLAPTSMVAVNYRRIAARLDTWSLQERDHGTVQFFF